MSLICEKEFTISITPGFPTPIAWWKMEEAGLADRIDSIGGVPMFASDNDPNSFITDSSGIILQGANFETVSALFTDSSASLHTDFEPSLAYSGDGFSTCVWFRWNSYDGASPGTQSMWNWFSSGNGFSIGTSIQWNKATGNLRFGCSMNVPPYQFPYIFVPFVPTLGTWYLFQASYEIDLINLISTFRVQINGDAVIEESMAEGLGLVSTPGTAGFVNLTANGGSSPNKNINLTVDECGIFNLTLSQEERDFIYNSGAGRTFPP